MEVKQSTTFKVPVRLRLINGGAGKTGLVYSSPMVYLQKQNGGSQQFLLTSPTEWVEIDATNMPGVYDLNLTPTHTNTPGYLKYTVQFL